MVTCIPALMNPLGMGPYVVPSGTLVPYEPPPTLWYSGYSEVTDHTRITTGSALPIGTAIADCAKDQIASVKLG